jgi:hypothetical protein
MTVVFAGTLFAVNATAVAQGSWQNSVADFSKICVRSLLVPNELAAALKDRGMSAASSQYAPPDWDGALYSATDGARGVSVTYQRYSDLTISNCITVAPNAASRDDLENLRSMLETNPGIGKIEGRILEAAPTTKIAMFKRPGNAPIVTFLFTSMASATTLSMTRFDSKPGN